MSANVGNLLIARPSGSGRDQIGGGGGSTSGNVDRDRLEFSKFCKFFTIRVVQVVVQSRTGRKIRSQSRVVGQPSDWFNVNVDELQEVNDELKRALDGQYLAVSSNPHTICLLISLRTIDGDTLHLEVWQLSLDTEQCDPGVSVRSHLYHRMSVLLRSAVAASRVTPAYKLYSRRQGPESFVLRYQISAAPVQMQVLGDGAKSIDLGFVASPFGMVRLAVHYRTKMVISDSAVQLSGALRENYYVANAETTKQPLSTPPKEGRILTEASVNQEFRQQPLINTIPWAPLPEPSSYKALPPLPDFSPCFSTFSTSPMSGDFQFSPSPVRRPSAVAFQLGGGATSCSSSEEGGQFASGASTTAGPLVPLRLTNQEDTMPKRNSSGTLFKMELSGAGGGGGGGTTSPKPSSFPDHQSGGGGGDFRGSIRGSVATIRRDTFPFAHLLSSYSAPNFSGGFVGAPPVGQYQLTHRGSLSGGIAGASSTALCKYSPKRRAVTAVAEEQPGLVAESDENLESSREVMVADGVKIVEKRRTRRGKKKEKSRKENLEGNQDEGGNEETKSSSESESSSSCDDSFVRYEMRPVFASGSDLGAFFNQCKSAPSDLKSFASVFAQPLTMVMPTVAESTSTITANTIAAAAFVRRSLDEIKVFEEKQKIFDDFVNSLKVDSSGDEEEKDQGAAGDA